MKLLILVFVAIINISAQGKEIYFVTNWGDNDKVRNYINKTANHFNQKNRDSIIVYHSKEPNEYIRESDYKFMLNSHPLSPDLFVPSQNVLYGFIDACESLNKKIPFKRFFLPILQKELKKSDYKIFPLEISTFLFFYNKRLFRELHIPLKKNKILNMDDFVQICLITRFYSKAKNITPIVIGIKGNDYWRCSFFIYHILLRVLGPEKFSLLLESKVPWNDKKILKSLKITNMLFNESAIINKDAADITDIEAQQRFQSKQAAMYFSGSWYLSSDYQPSEIGAIPFFNINEYPQGKDAMFLNISKSISVHKNSHKKEQATSYLRTLNEYSNKILWTRQVETISAFQGNQFSGINKDILNILNRTRVVNLNPEFYRISKEYYLDLMNMFYKIFLGKKSIEEIQDQLERFHQKVMKNGWYQTNE